MSDIRFNRWLHQSGTGGVYQDSAGNVGIGTSVPTTLLDIQGGNIKIGDNTLSSSGVSTFADINSETIQTNLINVGSGTSINSPATNTLSLGVNDSESVRLNSNGHVGILSTLSIGTNTQVTSSTGLNPVITVGSATTSRLVWGTPTSNDYRLNTSGGGALVFGVDGDSENFAIEGHQTGIQHLKYFGIDNYGRVTKPYQPAFAAYDNSGTTRTGGATIIWNVELFDIGNNYSTSTGRFTAPVSGLYFFRTDFRASGTSGAPIVDIITSNGYITRHEETAGIVNQYHQSLCMICYLGVNDYAYVRAAQGDIRMDTNQIDNFAGYLVS